VNPWLLLLTAALLVANGFFVAMEFALIASRRTKLESLAEEGDLRARLALEATGALSLQLAGAQLGITMASLGLGAVAEPTLAHGLETVFGVLPAGVRTTFAFVIALAIVVFLHMVIGEMVPKNAAIADPEKMMLRLSIPNRIYVAIFRPLIVALNGIANFGTRLFGVEPRDEVEAAHTAGEIATMLAASREEGLIEETAHDLLSGALGFGHRRLREVMLPLEQVVKVPQTATVAEAERVVVDSGHSRLVVTGHDPSDIIGFVHAKDLLTVPADARNRSLPLSRIRRVLVLESDRPLDEVLVAMRRARTHVAVVIDVDRTPVGLATLEDVLEDLVGDITDESDRRTRLRTPTRRRTAR
jgi:CBS domain containing-hemolysin-like protein